MRPVCFSPARMRAIRDDRGYTRGDLAARCGISSKAVARYETGDRVPDAAVLGRLAAELGCSVDSFYVRFAFEWVPDAV